MTFQYPAVSRRNLMKSVAAAGLLANFSITPLSQAVAAAMDDMETVRWTSCVVNCGSRCPLKAIVKNGQVIRIEPENTAPTPPRCLWLSRMSEPACEAAPCVSACTLPNASSTR